MFPVCAANHSPLEGESQKPSRQAKADAVGGESRTARLQRGIHTTPGSRLRCHEDAAFTVERDFRRVPPKSPGGDILPRLRRSKRKACRTSFLGRPGLTAASPLSPKPQHCRETGLLKDNPRAPARGSSGAANAAAALSRGRKPMETATPPSRVGGDSNPPWCSIANRPGRAQRSLYPECSPKKSLDVRQMNSIW